MSHLLFHLPDLFQAGCLLLLQLLLVLLQVLCHLGGSERQGIRTAQTGNLTWNPASPLSSNKTWDEFVNL